MAKQPRYKWLDSPVGLVLQAIVGIYVLFLMADFVWDLWSSGTPIRQTIAVALAVLIAAAVAAQIAPWVTKRRT